jgi:hypothetical protein
VAYNAALIACGLCGYIAYLAVINHYVNIIGQPVVDSETGKVVDYFLDSGGIESLFQCCGAFIAILLANVCYLLGEAIERFVPQRHIDTYRTWAWWSGLAFSCCLPFSIAALHLMCCWFFPTLYDHTPLTF